MATAVKVTARRTIMADGSEERITRLETAFESTLPHLATKADISRLEAAFESTLPYLATKADIAKLESKMALGGVSILAALLAIIAKLFT